MLERMWGKENHHSLLVGLQPLWKSMWRIHKNLKINVLHDPALACNADPCSAMSIAALFTTARKWNQPRCPSVDGRRVEIWYMHTMGLDTDVRKKKDSEKKKTKN